MTQAPLARQALIPGADRTSSLIAQRLHAALMLAVALLVLWPPMARTDPFPVEITHRFGTASIPAKPRRIVSLSYIGHDFLLALGETPYALRKWYGNDPYGVWPWGHAALGDARPVVMQGQIDIERIAAMEPDLITAQWSGITKREYALLSRIAPTIAPRAEYGDFGSPWPEMLRTLGRATGTLAKAESIITRIETRFAKIRAAHPAWSGATGVMVWIGEIGACRESDIRGQFMQALGFHAPEALDRIAGTPIYARVPGEDLAAIDVDALIWLDSATSVDTLARIPLRHTLRAHQQGREIYADQMLASALSHSSPLSLDYALDRLVPKLEAAMDGTPATPVPSLARIGLLPGEH